MVDSCRRTVEIEVPPEIVKQHAQTVAAQFQRRARMPGFRPGKAPLSVIAQRYRDDIRAQVVQELVPEYIDAEARQKNWELVGTPSISDVQYADDAPLKFKATLEVFPEITLQDYNDLRVEAHDPEVSGEEVERALENLQEQAAAYVNVDPRPLQDGDFASITLRGTAVGGKAAGAQVREILCEIGGSNTVPEFSENLRGAQTGDEREFDVAYAADFSDTRLAGKTVRYSVKVLGIKKKQVPALDDDLARQLGDYDSLEALRRHVGEELYRSKRRDAEDEARKKLRQELAKIHDFPVPETLIDRQVERRVDRFRRQLAAQGMNPKTLDVDWGKVRSSQRDAALEEIKSSLILEKIAEKENVEISEAELEREIEKLATATGQPAAALRARLTNEGGLDKLKTGLRSDKALDIVLHHATMSVFGRAG